MTSTSQRSSRRLVCAMALRALTVLPRLLRVSQRRALSLSATLRHDRLKEVLPPLESFAKRHIGPRPEDTKEMLKVCGVEVRKTL